MDFSIQIYTIRMGLSIIYLRGHRSQFPNNGVILSLYIAFILSNCVDPDRMPHSVAFHLGLYHLPKYHLHSEGAF